MNNPYRNMTKAELRQEIIRLAQQARERKKRVSNAELLPLLRAIAEVYPRPKKMNPHIAAAIQWLKTAENEVGPIPPRFRFLPGGKRRPPPRPMP